MHYSPASGSSLLSLICYLLVGSIVALSGSAWLDSAVMTRHIRHESSRLALFLTELIIASSHQNKPIPLYLTSGTLTAQIGDISQTFSPKHGTELSLPESDSATLHEIRYARSCSPTFALWRLVAGGGRHAGAGAGFYYSRRVRVHSLRAGGCGA